VVRAGDGNVFFINTEPTNLNNLGSRLQEIFKTRAERLIFVQPSAKSTLSELMGLIDTIANAGIDHIAIVQNSDALMRACGHRDLPPPPPSIPPRLPRPPLPTGLMSDSN
jgi:hypothetical protein